MFPVILCQTIMWTNYVRGNLVSVIFFFGDIEIIAVIVRHLAEGRFVII